MNKSVKDRPKMEMFKFERINKPTKSVANIQKGFSYGFVCTFELVGPEPNMATNADLNESLKSSQTCFRFVKKLPPRDLTKTRAKKKESPNCVKSVVIQYKIMANIWLNLCFLPSRIRASHFATWATNEFQANKFNIEPTAPLNKILANIARPKSRVNFLIFMTEKRIWAPRRPRKSWATLKMNEGRKLIYKH